jgi:hypothetical protein
MASTMFGLVLGTAAVAGAATGSIDTTGPDSTNKIEWKNKTELRVDNDNDVRLTNNNPQYASSGDAYVKHNTEAGDATSGDAANHSEFSASVSYRNGLGGWDSLFNAGAPDASIHKTGPDSYNKVEYSNSTYVNIRNDNDVNITNNNTQTAKSGDATVYDNTEGGSATSGSAENHSSATFEVNITN